MHPPHTFRGVNARLLWKDARVEIAKVAMSPEGSERPQDMANGDTFCMIFAEPPEI